MTIRLQNSLPMLVFIIALTGCSSNPAATPTPTARSLTAPTVSITYTADGTTTTIEGHLDDGLCTPAGQIVMRATDVSKDAGISFDTTDSGERPINGFARGESHDVMFSGKGAVTESEVDGKRVFSANDLPGWVNVGEVGTGPVELVGKEYETYEGATMSFAITCP